MNVSSDFTRYPFNPTPTSVSTTSCSFLRLVHFLAPSCTILVKITVISCQDYSNSLFSLPFRPAFQPFSTLQENKSLNHSSHHDSFLLTTPQWLPKTQRAKNTQTAQTAAKGPPGSDSISSWNWSLSPLPSKHTLAALFQSLYCVTFSPLDLSMWHAFCMKNSPPPPQHFAWWILTYWDILQFPV